MHDLFHDLKDGIVLLRLLDRLKPGNDLLDSNYVDADVDDVDVDDVDVDDVDVDDVDVQVSCNGTRLKCKLEIIASNRFFILLLPLLLACVLLRIFFDSDLELQLCCGTRS